MLRQLITYTPTTRKKNKNELKIAANTYKQKDYKLLEPYSHNSIQNIKINTIVSNKIMNAPTKKNKNILLTVPNSSKFNNKKIQHFSNYRKKSLYNSPFYDNKLKKIFQEIIDNKNNFNNIIKAETSAIRKSAKKYKNINMKNKDNKIVSLKQELAEMNKIFFNLENEKQQNELENLDKQRINVFSKQLPIFKRKK